MQVVGHPSLNRRQDRPAEDRHDEQGGNLALVDSRALQREAEGVRPTHRGEEPDGHHAPHGSSPSDNDGREKQHDDCGHEYKQGASGLGLAETEEQPAEADEGQVFQEDRRVRQKAGFPQR